VVGDALAVMLELEVDDELVMGVVEVVDVMDAIAVDSGISENRVNKRED
jgi:hypothetical protein